MARRLPARVLRHVATVVRLAEGSGEWVEGEPGDAPARVDGTPFPCILFLPMASDETPPQMTWQPSRVVTRPTMMWNLASIPEGEPQPANGVELRVDVGGDVGLARVIGGQRSRWLVEGDPQPFGPPGRTFAAQATLRQVKGA